MGNREYSSVFVGNFPLCICHNRERGRGEGSQIHGASADVGYYDQVSKVTFVITSLYRQLFHP